MYRRPHEIRIFAERKHAKLQTDKGTEFVNRPFQKYLNDLNIHHFTTENDDIKACVVERFSRTLKTKIWRYFTKNSTHRYLDVLSRLTKGYNDSYHSKIKANPSYVTTTTKELLRNFHAHPHKRRVGLTIGDHVRIRQSVQERLRSQLVGRNVRNHKNRTTTSTRIHNQRLQ